MNILKTSSSMWFVYAALFLIPTLIVPISFIPFQFSKVLIALLLVVGLFGAWVHGALRRGNISLWYAPLSVVLWLIPTALFVASLMSPHVGLSLFGYQFETDTFAFMFLGVALTHMLMTFFDGPRVMHALQVLAFAFGLVFVFQAIQLFFGAPFPFPNLADPVVNMIGRWSDVGVFAGLVAVLLLLSGILMPLSSRGRLLVVAGSVVSLGFLMAVNLFEVWVIVALVSVLLLILIGSHVSRSGISSLWHLLLPLGFFLVAVFAMLFGGPVANTIQNGLGILSLEARPSPGATLDVLRTVYASAPVFGSGPNTFSIEWFLHRPEGVLITPFWNVAFNGGFGMIPTVFVTGGLLTGLAWVVVMVVFLYTFIRTAMVATARVYPLLLLTGAATLYLFAAHTVFFPSQSLTLLLFIFLGLFLATGKGVFVSERVIMFGQAPRVRAVVLVSLCFLVLVVAGGTALAGRAYAASVLHQYALQQGNAGNLATAEETIEQAIFLMEDDRFLRTAALIHLAQVNRLIQESEDSDETRASFQRSLASAIEYTGRALAVHPDRYENWITRSLVYESVVPLRIEGASENARAVLEEARIRNPRSPEVDFRLATLDVVDGNTTGARTHLENALQKKPDYTPAILLFADIALAEENITEAIESVRAAVFFEPQNPVLLYQLGLLFLGNDEQENAVLAFETALSVQPDFANAAFFLAQAYARLGEFDRAAERMAQVALQNPENTDIAEFARLLAQGVNPFTEPLADPGLEDAEEVVE